MTAWSIWIELAEREYIRFSDKEKISLQSMEKISVSNKEDEVSSFDFETKGKFWTLNSYWIKEEDWFCTPWEGFKVLCCFWNTGETT